jgi:hypothetical protein
MDQRHFVFNDIVPITISDPTNSTVYTAIVNSDVNGYTWTVQNSIGTTTDAGTALYGTNTKQFEA